jgi:iron complex transport system permease protein
MSSASAGSMPARLLLLAPAAALATMTLWSLEHGQLGLSLPQVLQALGGRADETATRIVIEIRLPRVAAALLAGAALGVAGLVMQALFRNPLAEAWSLGLTAGGQMGAALVVVTGGWIGPAAVAAIGMFAGLGLVTGAAPCWPCGVTSSSTCRGTSTGCTSTPSWRSLARRW